MTRINTVPPKVLSDSHLLTEIREIPRVPTLVLKRLSANNKISFQNTKYTLGTGHVIFFYNKMKWLYDRLQALHDEADLRGFDNHRYLNDGRWDEIRTKYPEAWNDWVPNDDAIIHNWKRLHEKITNSNVNPRWYRNTLTKDEYLNNILEVSVNGNINNLNKYTPDVIYR